MQPHGVRFGVNIFQKKLTGSREKGKLLWKTKKSSSISKIFNIFIFKMLRKFIFLGFYSPRQNIWNKIKNSSQKQIGIENFEYCFGILFHCYFQSLTEKILNGKLPTHTGLIDDSLKEVIEIDGSYNQFHNILRLLDVLPNFPFTTSETMGDYYL